ncbi:MAG: hypothetical protein HYU66_26710 [Armatimonadetes bacterium]|nr:hypothetical protein [Armatimonadota bacterium]
MSIHLGPEFADAGRRSRQIATLVVDQAKARVDELIQSMTSGNADAALAEVEGWVTNYGPDSDQAAADLARARSRHAELTTRPAPTR